MTAVDVEYSYTYSQVLLGICSAENSLGAARARKLETETPSLTGVVMGDDALGGANRAGSGFLARGKPRENLLHGFLYLRRARVGAAIDEDLCLRRATPERLLGGGVENA